MSPVKLSHTAVSMYKECSEKYRLHYIDNLRPKKGKSSLLFGNAIDQALNILLETKNLNDAKNEFKKKWTFNTINNILTDLRSPEIVQFSKADLDLDLGVSEWDCLLNKGLLILDEYYNQVLPKFKEIIIVQKPIELQNQEGDSIRGALDLIARWEDNKIYLLDNKTSSVAYESDSAGQSPQLSLYYYLEKETYGLQGVGFIVIDKNLKKTITKTCNGCGNQQVSVRHTNCRVKDCSGKLQKSDVKFSVNIDYVINQVNEDVINGTIDAFDEANQGISNEVYEKNRESCFGKFGKCQYFDYCHKQDVSSLIKLNKT